jgi:hypothetical protein
MLARGHEGTTLTWRAISASWCRQRRTTGRVIVNGAPSSGSRAAPAPPHGSAPSRARPVLPSTAACRGRDESSGRDLQMAEASVPTGEVGALLAARRTRRTGRASNAP